MLLIKDLFPGCSCLDECNIRLLLSMSKPKRNGDVTLYWMTTLKDENNRIFLFKQKANMNSFLILHEMI